MSGRKREPRIEEGESRVTVGVVVAAEYLGVNYRTVQRWCEQGVMNFGVTPMGRRRIPVAEVLRVKRQMDAQQIAS